MSYTKPKSAYAVYDALRRADILAYFPNRSHEQISRFIEKEWKDMPQVYRDTYLHSPPRKSPRHKSSHKSSKLIVSHSRVYTPPNTPGFKYFSKK
jgi:hypothetical protein